MHVPVVPRGDLTPPGRWGSSVTKCGNKVVVIGGICLSSPAAGLVWCFDLKSGEWSQPTTTGDVPGPRWGHAATLVAPNKVLVLGGREGSKPVALSEFYVLDAETWVWTRHTTATPAPKGRYAFGSTLLSDNRILVFGGHGGRNRFYCDMHVLQFSLDDTMPANADPALVPFRSAGPSTPSSLAATPRATPNVLLGGMVGVGLGGSSGAGGSGSSSADPGTPFSAGGGESDDESSPIGALVPAPRAPTGLWLTPMTRGMGPLKRTGLCLTRVGTSPYVLLVGGYNGKETLGDLHVLHTGTWTWTQPQPRPPAPLPLGSAPRPFGSYPCIGAPAGLGSAGGGSGSNSAGGAGGGTSTPLDRQAFLLPPSSGHMMQLLPGGRYLLISGGSLSSTEMSTSNVLLDLRTWSWCAVTPEAAAAAAEVGAGWTSSTETPRAWHRCVMLSKSEAEPLLASSRAKAAAATNAPTEGGAAADATTAASPAAEGAPTSEGAAAPAAATESTSDAAPAATPAADDSEGSYLLVFGGVAGPCEALGDLYLVDASVLVTAAATAVEGTPVTGGTRGFQSSFALAPSMAVGMGGVGRLPSQTLLLSPETPAAAAAIVGGSSSVMGPAGALLPAGKPLLGAGGSMRGSPGLLDASGMGAAGALGSPASPLMMAGGMGGGVQMGMGSGGSPMSGMGGGMSPGLMPGVAGGSGGGGRRQQHGYAGPPPSVHPGGAAGGGMGGGYPGGPHMAHSAHGGGYGADTYGAAPMYGAGGMMSAPGGMLGVGPGHGHGGGGMGGSGGGGGGRGGRGSRSAMQHQQLMQAQAAYMAQLQQQHMAAQQQQQFQMHGSDGGVMPGYGAAAALSMQQQQQQMMQMQQQQLARQQQQRMGGGGGGGGGMQVHDGGMPLMGGGSSSSFHHAHGSHRLAGEAAGELMVGVAGGSSSFMPGGGAAPAPAAAPSSRIPPPIRVPGSAPAGAATGPLLRGSGSGSGMAAPMHDGMSAPEGFAPHFEWDPLSRSLRMAGAPDAGGGGPRGGGGMAGPSHPQGHQQHMARMQQQQYQMAAQMMQQQHGFGSGGDAGMPKGAGVASAAMGGGFPGAMGGSTAPMMGVPAALGSGPGVGGGMPMMGSAAVGGPAVGGREYRTSSFDGPDLTAVLNGLDRLLD